MKLDAKELRVSQPTEDQLKKIKRREIYIICDNVLDTYNIGSIFRLADAVAAKCVYLCGQTETPPYHRISKAAVGTEKWVPWLYASSAVEAIEDLRERHSRHSIRSSAGLDRESRTIDSRFRGNDRKSGNDSGGRLKVIAIEQSKKSIDFREANYELPIAFVVGNETDGVSREALKLADQIVEIPMFGVNISLNVMVSLAIVLFRAI